MNYSKIRSIIVTTFCLLAGLNFGSVQAQESAEFLQIRSEFHTAVDSMELKSIIMLEDRFSDFPDDHQLAPFARYYSGLAHYRIYTMFDELGEDRKEMHLDEAQKMLENAIELQPEFPDAHALLASVYGMKATGIFSGMRYGPKSESAMEKAVEQGPNNPRVRMLNGIGLLNKPSMWGGSVTGAIDELNAASDLFETTQPDEEFMPDWGHAECYAWLGQAYENNDQPEMAMEAYKQALEIDPNYGWVKYNLLPALASN